MQINKLIKKKNALALLAKIKKYEYEKNTYEHSLAVQRETVQKQKLALIAQQLSDIDTYLTFNLFPSHQKAIDQYSSYISERQQEGLILAEKASNESSVLLDNILKNNKAKIIFNEKSLECNKKLKMLIEFKQHQDSSTS